jgi:hypothetical protein
MATRPPSTPIDADAAHGLRGDEVGAGVGIVDFRERGAHRVGAGQGRLVHAWDR